MPFDGAARSTRLRRSAHIVGGCIGAAVGYAMQNRPAATHRAR
jgi:hypothetical protein